MRWFVAMLASTLVSATCVYGQTYDPYAPKPGSGPARTTSTAAPKMASGEFVDTPISDVIRVISDLTGWSIIMSPDVTKDNPRVNLWIKQMPPQEVLQQVVKLSGLVLHEQNINSYQIMSFDEYAKLIGVKREVRQLKNISGDTVVKSLTPFIEGQKASKIISVDSGSRVILLVPEPLLSQLNQLIDLMDVPSENEELQIVRLTHLDVDKIIPLLNTFLTQSINKADDNKGMFNPAVPRGAAARNPGGEPKDETGNAKAGQGLLVQFLVVSKLNTVVVRGLPSDVVRTVALIKQLDQPSELVLVSYQLQYTSAEEVGKIIDKMVAGQGSNIDGASRSSTTQRFHVVVSEQNNRVIVEGTPEDQKRMAEIIRAIDQPIPAGSGMIRVYRLENASADEVSSILQEMLSKKESENSAGTTPTTDGPSEGPAPLGKPVNIGAMLPSESTNKQPARVTPAAGINAVIVRASSEEQEAIFQVITELDKPREQVLVEVTLVTVTSNDQFNLGIELGGKASISGTDLIGFSTFGIGAVNPLTGLLNIASPSPLGANVGIINSKSDLSLVLNALRTVGNVRISSVPKVLVEDNSPATISQVSEEPYETTSQSDSSTLKSFGGFVTAGTSLTVVPHVSRDDWMRLEYIINLSSFRNRTSSQLAANIPPPRTSNESQGTVRVPSGRIVVLGGLVSTRDSDTVDKVPFLGDIPILGELFKNRTETKEYSTLFIFLRPVIMRDTNFEDLRLLSQDDLEAAKVQNKDFPTNPMKMLGASSQRSEGGAQ